MSYFTHYSTIITSSKWTVADSCPSSCVYLWLFLLSVSQMAEILHILSAAISIHPTYFTYRLPLHRCQFELKQTITYTSSFVSWNQLNTRLYRTFPICLYIIFFSYEQGQTPWNIPTANIQISIHFYEIWSKKHIISLRRMENERTK